MYRVAISNHDTRCFISCLLIFPVNAIIAACCDYCGRNVDPDYIKTTKDDFDILPSLKEGDSRYRYRELSAS